MNNATQNLILAEYAVKYVETIMSKGPGAFNRAESLVHRVHRDSPLPAVEEGPSPAPGLWDRVVGTPWERQMQSQKEARAGWPAKLPERIKQKEEEVKSLRVKQEKALTAIKSEDPAEVAILRAIEIEESGLGNCGEQAYVAFKYLATKKAPGLAVLNWDNGNHVFVVIGMEASVPKVSSATLMIPPVWGDAAVIYDPWYHEWFRVESLNDWQSRMKRIVADTLAVAPSAHWLNKASAKTAEETKGYAMSMVKRWTFTQKAYLPFVPPNLARLACLTKHDPILTLKDMKAPHFRGAYHA